MYNTMICKVNKRAFKRFWFWKRQFVMPVFEKQIVQNMKV